MLSLHVSRHAHPENAGFLVERKSLVPLYTLIHFYNSVEIEVDGQRIMTSPHAIILYHPKSPQYYKSYEPLLHDWLHFKADDEDMKNLGFELNKVYYPNNFEEITRLYAEIEAESYGYKDDCNELIRLKLRELFIKIARAINTPQKNIVDTSTQEKFRYLRGKMMSNLAENWSVAKMAKTVNLSESRFFTLYKTIFGISPTADIINAKINSAKNMLCFQNKKVGEIAENLGYQNVTHFIRQFKSVEGLTPSAYKRNFKSSNKKF